MEPMGYRTDGIWNPWDIGPMAYGTHGIWNMEPIVYGTHGIWDIKPMGYGTPGVYRRLFKSSFFGLGEHGFLGFWVPDDSYCCTLNCKVIFSLGAVKYIFKMTLMEK